MADYLTPLDASFLELEEADDCSHMHVGWAMIFDPTADGSPGIDAVRDLFTRRLSMLPRFRRRLSSPHTGRLSSQSWVEDADPALERQIRHAALPTPGDEAELLEWLGGYYSQRLDRARPLWEMTLVEGLAEGRWAVVAKVHHALVDGISGAAVTNLILDLEPREGSGSGQVLGFYDLPDNEDVAHDPLSALSHGVRAATDLAVHPRKLGSILARSRDLAEVLVRDELVGAPHSSLNVEIGSSRRMATVTVPLDEIKEVKNRLGGTVNDVVLASAAGGLRELILSRDEEPPTSGIRAMVPVSIRDASQLLALGNRVSSLFVELPVAISDPLERYQRTVEAAESLKRGRQSGGSEALVELAGVAPPLLHATLARLAFAPRLFNLTITNVPGSQVTQYAFGAPMRRIIPLVPIFANHAIGIAVVSYDGEVVFGLNADPRAAPDLERLEAGIRDAVQSLSALSV